MKTWDDYKNYVKSIDEEHKKEMEALERLVSVVADILSEAETD